MKKAKILQYGVFFLISILISYLFVGSLAYLFDGNFFAPIDFLKDGLLGQSRSFVAPLLSWSALLISYFTLLMWSKNKKQSPD